ncbi:MAG: 30S ribosomal protein S19e [Promethearchaeota archaeon]
MVTIYEVPAALLNKEVADELKNIDELKPPTWAAFVKTGVFREKAPTDPEWWYVRLASLLRKIYTHGPIGVNRLRVKYGGRQRKGNRREHFKKGAGKIIRYGLQQLESLGFVERLNDNSGRIISPKGRSFMDRTANRILKQLEKET